MLQSANSKEFLWTEKYRPSLVADVVLPKNMKDTFQSIVDSGDLPNMLLTGTGGVGKTTIARALCRQLDMDMLFINGSEESGIDVLRSKIRQFAGSVSLNGGIKCVIIDECDYLNASSTQPALRGFMEEFSDNCRFILTCNYKNRVIPAIHSRCSVHEFAIKSSDLPELAAQVFQRLSTILTQEGVEFDPPALAELIKTYHPDWRRVINECQRYSVSGKIDAGILTSLTDTNWTKLVLALKDKDFKAMRIWVAENIDSDATKIYRGVIDNIETLISPQSIPEVIIIAADYQYKAAFVADIELNTVAFLTEVMAVSKWQ